MIVWVNGEKARAQSSFLLSICPARHLAEVGKHGERDVPAEWVDNKNNPIDLHVIFEYGRAEVDENLGRYLIKYGFASKTKLIIPDGIKAA
jgi:hypothetical protein